MNEEQLNLFTKIKTLEEEYQEEIERSINAFTLNTNLIAIREKLQGYKKLCKHEIVEDGICVICRKRI